MFGKRQNANAITVIAAGSQVVGTLRVKGIVQVDGSIEGTLIAEGHVSVGPEGRILGEVTANELSVGGCIEGTLLAKGHLHVLATGKVQGEARYATLEVDRGGVMDGRASHVEESARKAPDTSRVEIIENAAAE